MINYFDILKSVCVLAHEEKPLDFSTNESPYTEIKQYIKDTLEEVCSKFYWTFRERIHNLTTVNGQREYTLPSGMQVYNIIENGVRVEDSSSPLYFMLHNDLDRLETTSDKPYRYSTYGGKLTLDPTPDKSYSMQIKYLTTNYAYDSTGTTEKTMLDLEDDITILPDRFVKVIEWGAYSLYRQNYKPDNKYRLAREKFLEYLLDMKRQDGFSGDASPAIIIDKNININQLLLKDFYRA